MYASRTKRLCVRGAPSEETRVHQHRSSSEAASELIQQQNLPLATPVNRQSGDSNMVVAPNDMTNDVNQCSTPPTCPPQNNVHTLSAHQAISESDLIERLAKETLEKNKIELLISIRNLITACNKKKDSILNNPNFTNIISLIDDDDLSPKLKTQLALLLCSIAKGGEHNVILLNEFSVDEKILNLILNTQDEALVEACLRCLRSLTAWPRVSRTWLPYGNHASTVTDTLSKENGNLGTASLQKIITYAQNSSSFIIQECVADIFAATSTRNKDQTLLYKASAVPCIVQLLESSSERVVTASLNWLTQMCLRNHTVSLELVKAVCPSGKTVLNRLISMMDKDRCNELQFLSAKSFAHIYRALITDDLKDDPRIVSHVLPTLIRMVHRDKPSHLRIKSAECIAYLIEFDTKLQNTASFCDHLIDSLASMLEVEQNSILFDIISCSQTQYECSRVQFRGAFWLDPHQSSTLDLRLPLNETSKGDVSDNSSELNQEMKRAAFLALASLASNLEPIRDKIFSTCSIMNHLVKSLTDSDTKTLKSVLTCLLSLSRSVQQLRTSFAENSVYNALKSLLTTSSNDVLILVLAILCNISLDFSPGKQHFLDPKTIDTLCNLTKRSDPALRLHGMWILMNMVYQLKDQNLKFQILRSLGINHVLELIHTPDDEEIVLKTLGFLRNILSHKSHIDAIMSNFGEQIMSSLTRVILKPVSNKIKEQALCVLTNIADGKDSKKFIMENMDILSYIGQVMCNDVNDLTLAAICCITNLASKDYEGSYERRDLLKKLGIEDQLKSMLNNSDPVISDRVRTAYNQFLLIRVDDKYVN